MNLRSPTTKKRARSATKTVDEYFDHVPETALPSLTKLRAIIRSALPREASETISYNIPAFKHGRILVWYAVFSNHVSLFPGASIIERFKDQLNGYTLAKGTIQFPLDKRLPATLIKKIVKARVAEVSSKKT